MKYKKTIGLNFYHLEHEQFLQIFYTLMNLGHVTEIYVHASAVFKEDS